MMSNRELLKSMLNNIINDKKEEAAVDMHAYLSDKMKKVMGSAVTETATFTNTNIVSENTVIRPGVFCAMKNLAYADLDFVANLGAEWSYITEDEFNKNKDEFLKYLSEEDFDDMVDKYATDTGNHGHGHFQLFDLTKLDAKKQQRFFGAAEICNEETGFEVLEMENGLLVKDIADFYNE